MGNDYGRFYERLRKEQRQEQGSWEAIGPEMLMALKYARVELEWYEAMLNEGQFDSPALNDIIAKAEKLSPNGREDENCNQHNGE